MNTLIDRLNNILCDSASRNSKVMDHFIFKKQIENNLKKMCVLREKIKNITMILD